MKIGKGIVIAGVVSLGVSAVVNLVCRNAKKIGNTVKEIKDKAKEKRAKKKANKKD